MATAALGHGTAGSGEAKASRPLWPTLRVSEGFTESSARGRKGWKGLEQHGHARARPAAVMATRWSRRRGELYLGRKWSGRGVAGVERFTAGLWLG